MLRTLLVGAFLAAASMAMAQDFQNEAQPLFENCGDPSLTNAKQNGITLGISPSPPYSSLDPGSNKASGLDVEIHEAALQWIGINKIRYEVRLAFRDPVESLHGGDGLQTSVPGPARNGKALEYNGRA